MSDHLTVTEPKIYTTNLNALYPHMDESVVKYLDYLKLERKFKELIEQLENT